MNIYIYALVIFGWSIAHAQVEGKTPVIEVYGNRYLSDEAIIQMSGLASQPYLSSIEVEKKLQTTNLFTRVKVERSPLKKEAWIHVVVLEKSTTYFLPYLSRDAFSSVYGLVGAKSSLFGQNSMILARYQFGSDDHQGTFLLLDEFFLNTPLFLGFSLDFENSLHRVFHEREVGERWSNRFQGGSVLLGYHFNPWGFARFNTYMERHIYEERSLHVKSGFQMSHRIFAECGKYFVNEGLAKGYQLIPSFEFTNPVSDFQFTKIGISAQISLLLVGDFNWNTQPSFKVGNALPRYQLFEVGGRNLRGFPSQQFRSDSLVTIQNDFLITSFNFWKMKIRPLVFTDYSYIENGSRTGVGTGFYVYFREVSVPAIQVFAGYGFHPDGFSVSAAIGPQF